MKWETKSKYHIQSGQWKICKVTIDGWQTTIYELWKGKEWIFSADNAQACKAKALDLAK